MTPYLFIFFAIVFFSIGVWIDNFLTNRIFEDMKALWFYSNITNILFIPLLWIFGMPKSLPTKLIIPLLIVAIAQIAYLYPYFKALKIADTSVVTALFNLGKIFVPLFAFVIVSERLSMMQYVGFLIIVLSSFMLTYNGGLKINKALFYMILTSLSVAILSTVTKYSLESIDWITVITWAAIFSTVITLLIGLLFFRKEIIKYRKPYFKSFWQFMINEFVTFIAMACMIYAVALMPVTIVQGLLSLQPIFMMLIAFFGSRFIPGYFKEDIRLKMFLKKAIFFIIMAIGIWLTVG